MTEEFHLHLLKFTGSEDVVSRRHLIAKGLSNLGDSKGHLDPCGVENVLVVQEDSLCGLGSQVGDIVFAPRCTDVGLEHQIESSRLGESAGFLGIGSHHHRALCLGEIHVGYGLEEVLGCSATKRLFHLLLRTFGIAFYKGVGGMNFCILAGPPDQDVVRAVAPLGGPAVHHGVREAAHMTAGHPGLGVLNNGRIDADDVEHVSIGADRGTLHHVAPPTIAQVVLELGAQGAIVPEAVEASVDLAGGVHKSTSLAE